MVDRPADHQQMLVGDRRLPEAGAQSLVPVARAGPGVASATAAALAAISRCSDMVRQSGCRAASNYLDGAAGNLRRALGALVHRYAHLGDQEEHFDTRRHGESEVTSSLGFADTIRQCRSEDGKAVTAKALMVARDPTFGIWLRPAEGPEGLHVRGRVTRGDSGYVFHDQPDIEAPPLVGRQPDLGRDLVASGLDLRSRPALSAALEITLATGSWVCLAGGSRWYADLATAKAIIRLLGGSAQIEPDQLTRLGVCIDRSCLLLIEKLGWRQWPTPAPN